MRLIYIISMLLFGLSSLSSAAQPKAELSLADSVICVGDRANFTSSTTGVTSYYWMFGDNPQIGFVQTPTSSTTHVYNVAGTFIVGLRVVDAMGLSDTAWKTIRVKPNPQASIGLKQSPNPKGVFCVSTEFEIDRWSNISGFDSLVWEFGDGSMAFIKYPSFKYDTAGIYTIKLKAYGQCGVDSSQRIVEIVNNQRGAPDLNLYVTNSTVCLGEVTSVQANTYNEVLSDFLCYTGDGNITKLDEFVYTYKNTGDYQLMGIAKNVCGNDTALADVKVVTEIDKRPYLNADRDVCEMRIARIGVGTSGGNFDTAYVDFGDGDTAIVTQAYTNLMHAYPMSGTYTIQAIFTYESCSSPDTLSASITVDTMLNVFPFNLGSSKTQACPSEDIYLYGPSMGTGDTLIVNFGDGVTKRYADLRPSIVFSYANPGMYLVKAYRKTVCGKRVHTDSSTRMISIRGDIKTGLSISANYNSREDLSCAGDSLSISLSSSGDYTNPSILLPNGMLIKDRGYTTVFPNVGKYLILAYAENLCGLPIAAAHTVEVTNKMLNPSVGGYHYPRTQCVNKEFFFDIFTEPTTKIHWDFGDGNTADGTDGPHMMYAYNKAGVYDVTLTATNGCGVTKLLRKAYVEAGPSVSFNLSSSSINKGDTLMLSNMTTGQVGHLWVFGRNEMDTSTAWNVKRVYDSLGRHEISLFAVNEFDCWDTLSKFVNVGQISIVDPNLKQRVLHAFPNPTSGSLHIKLQLNGVAKLSLIDLAGREQYKVDVHAGTQTIQADISHLPRGLYILKLRTEDQNYSRRIFLSN